MTDVYVLMFLADTVDFIIIVFGFWAFGVSYYTKQGAKFVLVEGKLITYCARYITHFNMC